MQQADALHSAHYGFVDRYRALPGDAPRATISTPRTTVDGNGDGLVASTGGGSESVAAWEHLARAGFLTGGYRYGNGTEPRESAPLSPFGATPRMASNNRYAGAGPMRLNLPLGNLIPASTLAEVDRKLDDGLPNHASIRFSPIGTTGEAPDSARCLTGDAAAWRLTGSPEDNCAVTWLMQSPEPRASSRLGRGSRPSRGHALEQHHFGYRQFGFATSQDDDVAFGQHRIGRGIEAADVAAADRRDVHGNGCEIEFGERPSDCAGARWQQHGVQADRLTRLFALIGGARKEAAEQAVALFAGPPDPS